MHSTPPARRVLRAAAFAFAAMALGVVTASPVLARELASVRAWLPTVPDAASVLTPNSSPAQMVGAASVAATSRPVVSPTVSAAAVRTPTPPVPLVQDTTKRPTKQVEYIVRTSTPPPSKGASTPPDDAQVAMAPGSLAPRYPEILKSAGVSGVTIVQFVVDTTGLAIPSTLKVVRSGHALFTQSVQNALPGLRFLPARFRGRNVKQLAQMVYWFEVQGFPPRDTVVVPAGPMPTFKVVITGIVPPSTKGTLNFPSDAQVAIAPGSQTPRYPEILKQAGVSGETVVQFVVDTTGLVIPGTLKVVRSGHALFTQAVQNALPGLRFLPARVGARNVKQLAQMVYHFEVQGYPPADTVSVPSGSVPTFKVFVTAVAPK